jgi:hypothetical protein
MMVASANASSITFNTNSTIVGAATGFGALGVGGLTLLNSSGTAASLVFVPDGNSLIGIPTSVNLGGFTLACPLCTTLPGTSSFFNAFTFNLVVTDVSDGATGVFVGTSTGGAVYKNLSGLTVNWAPLILGPGTTNASTGNFGPTSFTTTVFTAIVPPNSGQDVGESTVQGFVNSSAIPEPVTFGLIGSGLLLLGLLRRRAH